MSFRRLHLSPTSWSKMYWVLCGMISAGALFSTVSTTAHAQYKWVDAQGKVVYSDTPPPAHIKQVEKKNLQQAPVTTDLPFEVKQAVKNFPVTLYVTEGCPPCQDARQFLQKRGVPFTEKSVTSTEDAEAFRKFAPKHVFPTVTIGREVKQGFEPNSWSYSLDAAQYPTSAQLPRQYQPPKAQPLVPPKPDAVLPATSSSGNDHNTK
jgi:glutaredoxin